MSTTETKIYANALNLIPELGPASLMRLHRYFKDFRTAWQASEAAYHDSGLDQKKINAIIAKRKEIKPEQSFEALKQHGISTILYGEKDYPELLSQIPNPPIVLYVRGNTTLLNNPAIAVVGTRKMTSYGKHATSQLVEGLVAARLNIVSGLAYGVDAEALNTTINMGGLPAAVLASSIDNPSISPRANYLLAQKVINAGCLLSEYPLGVSVQKQNFPIRNRIIAGLCLGTLVIEADEESGALITAQFALEQNREVFSVPGSVFSQVSRGTNKLIKQGAKLVSSAADILEELNLDISVTLPEPLLETDESEQELLNLLSREPTHIDDLIRQLKSNAAEVNTKLTMLELKGRVKNLGGSKYVKVR